MSPLVSIVTPAYNAERTIADAVRSVLRQTVPNWEMIVINDGSTDCTADVVRGFGDSRIRLIRQELSGRSAARNHGIRVATGKYFLFLDADDWLLPTGLADHLQFLSNHPEFGGSVSDGIICSSEGITLATLSQIRGPIGSRLGQDRLAVDPGVIGAINAVLVESAPVMKNGVLFEESLAIEEDWLFWTDIANHVSFGIFSDLTCAYRLHGENTSLTASRNIRLEELTKARNLLLKREYFSSLALSARKWFFQQLIIGFLRGRTSEQWKVLKSSEFAELPPSIRCRLLCLAATDCLLQGVHIDDAREWLSLALESWPRDVRARLLAFALAVNPKLAASAIRLRRLFQNPSSDVGVPRVAQLNGLPSKDREAVLIPREV